MKTRELIKKVEIGEIELLEAFKKAKNHIEFIDIFLKRNPMKANLIFEKFYDQISNESKVIMFKVSRRTLDDINFHKMLVDYYITRNEDLFLNLIQICKCPEYILHKLANYYNQFEKLTQKFDDFIFKALFIYYKYHELSEFDSLLFLEGITKRIHSTENHIYLKGEILSKFFLKIDITTDEEKENEFMEDQYKMFDSNINKKDSNEEIEIDKLNIKSQIEECNENRKQNNYKENKNIQENSIFKKTRNINSFKSVSGINDGEATDKIENKNESFPFDCSLEAEVKKINHLKPYSVQQCLKALENPKNKDNLETTLKLIPNILNKTSKRVLERYSCKLFYSILNISEEYLKKSRKPRNSVLVLLAKLDFNNISNFCINNLFENRLCLASKILIIQIISEITMHLDINDIVFLFDIFKAAFYNNKEKTYNNLFYSYISVLISTFIHRFKFHERRKNKALKLLSISQKKISNENSSTK
ncbi:hypothetical protein EDEG_00944 [Edhazardia aedis USNM 41457]|uniref:Telomere length regulation protein conserved domain-containing protein n=1 Tax=Edhazardia aedis (strain USNM 41457) TaxID=1003232 RepID=J9DBK5_EDHAE|nr:hypothetical protein EDEG_00944 [Edhazardia aedis USNM 41457]|eukprot:EJW04874.1 hypothetical protein EDEG_00944 [Edhazardia aedis USNM 41457]